MALNVKFLAGSFEAFESLSKDQNTFYLVTKTVEGVQSHELYLGNVKLSNQPEIDEAVKKITANETTIKNLNDKVGEMTALETAAQNTLVAAINEVLGKTKSNANAIGTLNDLSTEVKANLVAAVNELAGKITATGNAGKVTLKETASADFAKVYKLYQGATDATDESVGLVGTINIPKDMVVKSGSLVKDPAGQPAGTYIELVLANATNDKIYVNVANLIDVYTAKAGATEVQLAVSETGEISASLVDGGVATAKLADSAVTTVKIADAAVTEAKLNDAAVTTAKIADGAVTNDKLDATLKGSIGKANSAIQKVETGATNGTIKVDGTEVAVAGLGSAAFAETTAFDAAGAAAAVQTTAAADATAKANAAETAAKAHAETKATAAETAAKTYADGLNTAMDTRVDALETAIGKGGSVDTQIDAKINALDADVTSAAPAEAGKGLQVQVVEADGKVTAVNVTGNFDEAYDAKGAAAKAETNAKAEVTSLANGAVKDNTDAITAINHADTGILAQATTYVDNALTWGSFGN